MLWAWFLLDFSQYHWWVSLLLPIIPIMQSHLRASQLIPITSYYRCMSTLNGYYCMSFTLLYQLCMCVYGYKIQLVLWSKSSNARNFWDVHALSKIRHWLLSSRVQESCSGSIFRSIFYWFMVCPISTMLIQFKHNFPSIEHDVE